MGDKMNIGPLEFLGVLAAGFAAAYVYVVFPKWLEKFDKDEHTHGLKEPTQEEKENRVIADEVAKECQEKQ